MKSDAEEQEVYKKFTIDVDNTLEDILIVLSAEADPSIILLNPSGNQCLTCSVKTRLVA